MAVKLICGEERHRRTAYTEAVLVDPGNRTPAPGRLRIVQRFVNSTDRENEREELETPAALERLLAELDLLRAGTVLLTETDLRRALEVREALRELLLANNGGHVRVEALRTLESASRAAQFALLLEPGDGRLVAEAPGLDGALGRILGVVHAAMVDGSWKRLKACPREVCFWVFYDRSKNLSSKWCAMSVCGNRTKKARARTATRTTRSSSG
jgi:predicted RNA-binding Zn ribbon-like protein